MPSPESVYLDSALGPYHALRSGRVPADVLMLHANGFNGGTYRPLLERLVPHENWVAPDFRGHGDSWTPEQIRSWYDFIDDVITWERAGWFQRPLALGHSLGGVTALLTEALRPGTFRGIVLLDPVVFRPRFLPVLALSLIPYLRRHNPMVRGALARRTDFPDRATIVQSYAGKPAFASWEPGFLEAYIKWGTTPTENGVRLSCDRETEAGIFSTWPLRFWHHIRRVECPVLILRGANSRTLLPATARLMQRKLPHATCRDIPGAGHFLPMEQPDSVVTAVTEWQLSQRGNR